MASLSEIVSFHREMRRPLLPLGGASNILFPDEPLRASLVRLRSKLARVEPGGTALTLGAGVNLSQASRVAGDMGLSGLEMTAGLPGTVGGAVFGNAGSALKGVAELISAMTVLSPEGETHDLGPGDLRVGYRFFRLPERLEGSIITQVTLRLSLSDSAKVKAESRRLSQERQKSQPKGLSLGCVFKNPPGQSAGALIDQCGLKGWTVGEALVSDLHANFIINRGGAATWEILDLARLIRLTVHQRFNCQLEAEIRILDEYGRIRGLR
jgi:UDP-N-acetylmuramate dehydrogenase